MKIDQRRERPFAARLVDLRQQRLIAMAQILDVLDVEFVGPCGGGFRIHDGHSLVEVCRIVAQMPGRNNRLAGVPLIRAGKSG